MKKKKELPACPVATSVSLIGGKWKIYLNDQLVDMNRPVTVFINDRKVFEGKLVPRMEDMITSCMEYFDPCRVFPASVDVAL